PVCCAITTNSRTCTGVDTQMIRTAATPLSAKSDKDVRLTPDHKASTISPANCPTSKATRPRPRVADRPQGFMALVKAACPSRKSYRGAAMMQSGQDRCDDNGPWMDSRNGALGGDRQPDRAG